MSDPSYKGPAPVSLCRLCCCKLYAGESMLLMDTEKIKAWFKMYHSIELEVLPGYSNEICRFCVHDVNIVLRAIWGNEKTFSSSEAKMARRACSDKGTSGWTYCRACLGPVLNPDSCFTVWKYGILEINALFELLGFQLIFYPDFPDYLCSLCVSGMHKAINKFLVHKAYLTPQLEDFRHRLTQVPVPKSDVYQTRNDLPSIFNPATSIAEMIMSNISTLSFKQWLASDASGRPSSETSCLSPTMQPCLTEPTPSTSHNPLQPIRPKPRLAEQHMALPPLGPHPLQHQIDQIKINQCLSAARNVLSNINPVAPNPLSPLAMQMAIAQQLSNNPFLGPFHMPFPVAPNPLLMHHLQLASMRPPAPINPMSNLFVKRMNEETTSKDEVSPPVKKRRGRKPNKVHHFPPVEVPPQEKLEPAEGQMKSFSRPDQFVMQDANGRSPLIFNSQPAVMTSHFNQVPVIQHHQQTPPVELPAFNHEQMHTAPVYYPPVALVPSQPVGSPAPSSSASSSGTSQPPASTSPLAQSLSPTHQAANPFRTNAMWVIISPAKEVPVIVSGSQNVPSTSPTGQPELVGAAPVVDSNSGVTTRTPPKDEQQLKVPPLKIRLSDINQSPEGKRSTPPRPGLPAIVQKGYAKADDQVQQKITAYRAEEANAQEEFSLKNLLDNSPPAAKVPDSVVSKFDDVYYKNDCSIST